MAKVRDHYFEVRPDGTYIYLGSTNPEAISRGEETDMFFANGIDNPVCVIRGAMATIQPPQPSGHFEDLGGSYDPEPMDDGPEFHAPLGDGDRDSFDYEYLDF